MAGLGARLRLRGEAKQVPDTGMHGAGLRGLGAWAPLEHAGQGGRERGREAAAVRDDMKGEGGWLRNLTET